LVAADRIDLNGLQPTWFQSYFTEHIGFFLTDGRVSANGDLKFEMDKTDKKRTRGFYGP